MNESEFLPTLFKDSFLIQTLDPSEESLASGYYHVLKPSQKETLENALVFIKSIREHEQQHFKRIKEGLVSSRITKKLADAYVKKTVQYRKRRNEVFGKVDEIGCAFQFTKKLYFQFFKIGIGSHALYALLICTVKDHFIKKYLVHREENTCTLISKHPHCKQLKIIKIGCV